MFLLIFADKLAVITCDGWPNYYGQQRFGHNKANLQAVVAWAQADYQSAVSWLCDPSGAWRWTGEADSLNELGFVAGPVGRLVGALRQGRNHEQAFRRAGEQLQRL